MIIEELPAQAEDCNNHDEHAVAVTKGDCIVGHVPRTIARVSWLFLRHGGHIICRVTGQRKHGDGPMCHAYTFDPAFIRILLCVHPALIRASVFRGRRLIEEIR